MPQMHATNQAVRTSELFGQLNSFEAKYAPEGLYLAGDASLLSGGRRVSIVGTRKPSPEGMARARALTRMLVAEGIIVVSGLAEGIDTVAHETAMAEGGRTITVLGTPLSQAYPARNRDLLERIKAGHLAISQFPEGMPARRTNFPQRNRTMALISDATVIIEAGENSGTRHQGWEALRLGRMVFLMQSVAENPDLTWPKEMIGYGAQILRREDMPDVLHDIPGFTAASVSAF
ncbi:DNA-processing protein DprA [Mameliella sp. CS4]|uniref:DNA-processing protein DprA n=1 Tax=Mameliella sp. CS4 TaxID=2862329 RepID=UPI0021041BD9|nr:DNA-processing protein DprA [Mameliella sp. CS4]